MLSTRFIRPDHRDVPRGQIAWPILRAVACTQVTYSFLTLPMLNKDKKNEDESSQQIIKSLIKKKQKIR